MTLNWKKISIDRDGHARLNLEVHVSLMLSTHLYIGTHSYRDCQLNKVDTADYGSDIDIWSLGALFYILEKQSGPWDFSENLSDYSRTIEEKWDFAMNNVAPLMREMLSIEKGNR